MTRLGGVRLASVLHAAPAAWSAISPEGAGESTLILVLHAPNGAVDPDATFRTIHVLARFDLPYRLFEFVAAVRALEFDHMRINTCHLRMPPSRLRDQGTQRDTRQEVPDAIGQGSDRSEASAGR